MLYATGLTEEDMHKAQVGIASLWWEGEFISIYNIHLFVNSWHRQPVQHASIRSSKKGQRGMRS
jgi:hypothetical protein